jgi:hypothetical protein
MNEDRGDLLRYVDEIPTSDTSILGEETGHSSVVSSRFNTQNEQPIPTSERATNAHNTVRVTLQADAFQLLGRRRGRRYVVLSCPATITTGGVGATPLGFQVSHDRNNVTVGIGYQVNPGDSLEIDSEAEVYVGPLPGNTTGTVQYSEAYTALGGPATS